MMPQSAPTQGLATAEVSWPAASYFDAATSVAQARLSQLELIDRANWCELYRHKLDGSFWRLDAADKYQQRFLVRIADETNWANFDASALEKALLLAERGGFGTSTCIRQGCSAPTLQRSAFCLEHSYEQGLRR